jgi:hypothetical protein
VALFQRLSVERLCILGTHLYGFPHDFRFTREFSQLKVLELPHHRMETFALHQFMDAMPLLEYRSVDLVFNHDTRLPDTTCDEAASTRGPGSRSHVGLVAKHTLGCRAQLSGLARLNEKSGTEYASFDSVEIMDENSWAECFDQHTTREIFVNYGHQILLPVPHARLSELLLLILPHTAVCTTAETGDRKQ